MSVPFAIADPRKLTAPNRIYCDVDGVLALFIYNYEGTQADYDALGDSRTEIPFPNPYNPEKEEKVSLRWKSKVVEILGELSRREDVDFVWLTSWRGQAPASLDSLWNINSKGFLPWAHKMSDFGHSFKYVALEEAEKLSPSRFVWIDDFAIRNEDHLPRIRKYTKENDFMAIITDHKVGLTLEDLANMTQFFDAKQENA